MVSRVLFLTMKTLKSCPLRPATDHGKKLVYIEELPESHHCIFYCESQDPGKKFRMGKLMGEGSSETPVSCPMVPTPQSQGTAATPWHRALEPWAGLCVPGPVSCPGRDEL